MNKLTIDNNFNDVASAIDYLKKSNVVQCEQWFSCPREVVERVGLEAQSLYSRLLGFSNNLYRLSNSILAKLCKCSVRTIQRLLDELIITECIKQVYINKSVRLIYPLFTLPIIIDNRKSSITNNPIDLENGGFDEL